MLSYIAGTKQKLSAIRIFPTFSVVTENFLFPHIFVTVPKKNIYNFSFGRNLTGGKKEKMTSCNTKRFSSFLLSFLMGFWWYILFLTEEIKYNVYYTFMFESSI